MSQNQPSKTQAILQEVDKVKDVMHNNIGLMLDNHDKATNLQDKTASMNNNAKMFKKQTVTIRRQMWCRNMKLQIIIVLVFIHSHLNLNLSHLE
ncbi:synaptobrevin domain-containing protein [Heterostelium album PN500]|uniref:Synaptobrevin domain-containing protein n=1 Tax=Heterostelium pallidum (strain ATCC 26659 / Pp 5 / PN500) TaxID=670386 RepID=D3B4M2_HETP5|nr:synaptobrevin domain-containing protein [Heterostelium album PN500]EFA84270.1 synaptobrevin domain-containing protein [Heterostelium album PN500]|eukprot:XP_020436386.1 synaptobrevin domain-containing protein [Heterostelium album PN500]